MYVRAAYLSLISCDSIIFPISAMKYLQFKISLHIFSESSVKFSKYHSSDLFEIDCEFWNIPYAICKKLSLISCSTIKIASDESDRLVTVARKVKQSERIC